MCHNGGMVILRHVLRAVIARTERVCAIRKRELRLPVGVEKSAECRWLRWDAAGCALWHHPDVVVLCKRRWELQRRWHVRVYMRVERVGRLIGAGSTGNGDAERRWRRATRAGRR